MIITWPIATKQDRETPIFKEYSPPLTPYPHKKNLLNGGFILSNWFSFLEVGDQLTSVEGRRRWVLHEGNYPRSAADFSTEMRIRGSVKGTAKSERKKQDDFGQGEAERMDNFARHVTPHHFYLQFLQILGGSNMVIACNKHKDCLYNELI